MDGFLNEFYELGVVNTCRDDGGAAGGAGEHGGLWPPELVSCGCGWVQWVGGVGLKVWGVATSFREYYTRTFLNYR